MRRRSRRRPRPPPGADRPREGETSITDNTPIIDGNSTLEGIATELLSTLNGTDITGDSPRTRVQQMKILAGAAGVGTVVSPANGLPIAETADYIDENGNTDTVTRAGFALTFNTTDQLLVTGVTSKVIRVLALVLLAGNAATNVTFNSKPSGAGSAISMLFQNNAYGGAVLPFNKYGWFQTNNTGEGLSATISNSGVNAGCQIVYVTV